MRYTFDSILFALERIPHGLKTRGTMGLRACLLALGLLFLCSGCAPTREQRVADRAISDYFMGDYDRAEKALQPLSTKTNEDFVLNNVRLGSVALANYDLDAAEAAFLRAYEVI